MLAFSGDSHWVDSTGVSTNSRLVWSIFQQQGCVSAMSTEAVHNLDTGLPCNPWSSSILRSKATVALLVFCKPLRKTSVMRNKMTVGFGYAVIQCTHCTFRCRIGYLPPRMSLLHRSSRILCLQMNETKLSQLSSEMMAKLFIMGST